MTIKKIMPVLYTLLLSVFALAPDLFSDSRSTRPVGEFSRSSLEGWQSESFVSRTRYSLAVSEGITVLKAESRSSSSGMGRSIRIDLEKYPYLNWSWRIENKLTGVFDERVKSGDDHAARVYVVVSGGLAVWNTRAVNYVWARHAEVGATWPSAYSGERSMHMVLQSFQTPVQTWQYEKRNVRKDLKMLFGRDIRYIDAVAVMTDTDDTRQEVTAFYGDIYFSAE